MKTILVWAENEGSLKPLVDFLETTDHNIVAVTSVNEVLGNVAPTPPDLAFFHAPVFINQTEEFEVIETAIPPGMAMPIIWFNVSPPTEEEMEAAVKCGAIDFWYAPFTGEACKPRLESRLNEREKFNELLRRIENNQAELELARRVQQQLLPKKYPNVHGVRFAARYVPTEQVGGDFYDMLDFREDSAGVFIADVSGHGVAAAFTTMSIKTAISTWARGIVSPGETMILVNNLVKDLLEGSRYVTAVYGHLDAELMEFNYANAGHPPPLVFRPGEKEPIELKTDGGFPLGIIDDSPYPESTFKLQAGDFLFMYTDGITEALNKKDEFYGEEKVAQVIWDNINKDADTILDTLLQDVVAFADGRIFNDDINLIGIQVEEQSGLYEASNLDDMFNSED